MKCGLEGFFFFLTFIHFILQLFFIYSILFSNMILDSFSYVLPTPLIT